MTSAKDGHLLRASTPVTLTAFHGGQSLRGSRDVSTEVPVALSYGGTTQAVMMATPQNLVDLAIGFTLSEGIASLSEILSVEQVLVDGGIDLQIALASHSVKALAERRRTIAGPVGCGLCGIESIGQAMRPVSKVNAPRLRLKAADIANMARKLADAQPIFAKTRATHAAAFYASADSDLLVREDVGRHNALDKLCGALAQQGQDAGEGAIFMTSRISVELVQKAAAAGAGYLVAVSAPTSTAISLAEEAGICLVGLARDEDFEIFTFAERIHVE